MTVPVEQSLNSLMKASIIHDNHTFSLQAWDQRVLAPIIKDVTIDVFLPTIHDDLMKIFYSQTAAELETADETKGSVTGSYKGYGYKLNNEMLEGSAMIVSEDGKKALFLRNVQGFPSLVYDSPLDTPMGVSLSLQLVGGDAEADMAFLEWTPA